MDRVRWLYSQPNVRLRYWSHLTRGLFPVVMTTMWRVSNRGNIDPLSTASQTKKGLRSWQSPVSVCECACVYVLQYPVGVCKCTYAYVLSEGPVSLSVHECMLRYQCVWVCTCVCSAVPVNVCECAWIYVLRYQWVCVNVHVCMFWGTQWVCVSVHRHMFFLRDQSSLSRPCRKVS